MTKPTKILHVIDSLGRRGGAERQLALEIGMLDRERFTNHICYLRPPDYLEPLFRSMDVPVHRLDVFGKRHWISGIYKLRKLVKSLEIDLIHTSLYDSDIVGGITGKLTGVPVVSTLTSSLYEPEWLVDNPHVNRYKLAFARLTRAFVARYCDYHVVAISESVRKSAMRQLGLHEHKISVIYRAVSPEWLSNGAPPTRGEAKRPDAVPEGDPVLINTGRLEPPKGQRYIIEAMPQVLRQFPQAVLLIVGEGSLQPQLAGMAHDLGVQDSVFFLGQRTDVKQLLEYADIFVFPSLYEGLGNALIESMVMGLPSIVSNIPTFIEVSQEGKYGTLVPLRDPQAIAEAVINLASHPKEAKLLGQRASEMARHKFVLDEVVNQRSAAYERCLAKVGS